MLVINVELHSARTNKVSLLGRMIISNDGTVHDERRGDYDVRLGRKGKLDVHQVLHEPQRRSRVENYPRLAKPVWELVRRALNTLYEPRPAPDSIVGAIVALQETSRG